MCSDPDIELPQAIFQGFLELAKKCLHLLGIIRNIYHVLKEDILKSSAFMAPNAFQWLRADS